MLHVCIVHDYILNFVFLFWVLFPACLTKVDRTDILAFFPPELSGNVFSLSPLSVMRDRDFSKIPFMGEITSYFPIAERFSVLFLRCTVLHFVKQFCSFKMTKCF